MIAIYSVDTDGLMKIRLCSEEKGSWEKRTRIRCWSWSWLGLGHHGGVFSLALRWSNRGEKIGIRSNQIPFLFFLFLFFIHLLFIYLLFTVLQHLYTYKLSPNCSTRKSRGDSHCAVHEQRSVRKFLYIYRI